MVDLSVSTKMKVVFRTDASTQIGSGHVMRCLTLANSIRECGGNVSFICKEHESNLISKIVNAGYEVKRLSINHSDVDDNSLAHAKWLGGSQKDDAENTIDCVQALDVDWMIVDHYAIDEYWHKKIRPHVKHTLVIDDLGDRKHDCDVLLDQNLGSTREKYRGIAPNSCELLLGPEYALLRPEFAEWREKSLKRRSNITNPKNIFISLGGVDPLNITSEVINIISDAPLLKKAELNVVVGSQCVHLELIKDAARKSCHEVNVYVDTDQVAKLLSQADIAIGASGSSTWERCALGVPSIMFVVADNQKIIASELHEKHASIAIASHTELQSAIREITEALIFYSKNSANVLDGLGTPRVVNKLLFSSLKVKANDDSELRVSNLIQLSRSQQLEVLAIRNHPNVRASMFSAREISSKQHFSFLEELSADVTRQYYAVYISDALIGVIYFTEIDWKLFQASFGIYSNLIKRVNQAGQKLMLAALSLAHEFQFNSLLLQVDVVNHKAIKLYERFDFEKIDTFHSNGRAFITYKRNFS